MNMLARLNRGDGLFPVTLHGVDDLFNTLLGNLAPGFGAELMFDRNCAPQLELVTDEKEVIARLPLPGCKPADIDIEVVGDMLTVRATRSSEAEPDAENAHFIRRERSFGEYEESVKLPVPVKGAETTAAYTDGVLVITMPREIEEKPRTHVVKVN